MYVCRFTCMFVRAKSQHLKERTMCKSTLIDWWEIARDFVVKYSACSTYQTDTLMTLITNVSGYAVSAARLLLN